MTKLWINCRTTTGQVDVEHGLIIATPPIWKKFLGLPITRLTNWLQYSQGPVRWEKL